MVLICAGLGGFYLGSTYQEKAIVQEEVTDKYMSTKIAVVNQDEGIDYDGTNKNYATELLNASEEDYVLTSKAAADKGIEDGIYGAYIVLPGGFSKNISSINDVTPIKAEMHYKVNDKLSADKKIVVNESINSLISKFKSKTSYMYVASILREFHEGQASINKVLSNNDKEEKNINSISDSEILANLKLNELKKVELKLEKLDITENYDNNVKEIKKIDDKYTESIAASNDSVENIKAKAISSNDTLKTFNFALDSININPTEEEKYNVLEDTAYNEVGLKDIEEIKNSNSKVVNQMISDADEYVLNQKANGDTTVGNLYVQIEKIRKNVAELDGLYKELNTQNTAITNIAGKVNNINTYRPTSLDGELSAIKEDLDNEDANKNKEIVSLKEEYKIYSKLLTYLKTKHIAVLKEFSTDIETDSSIKLNNIILDSTKPNIHPESNTDYISKKGAGSATRYEQLKVTSYSVIEANIAKINNKISADYTNLNGLKVDASSSVLELKTATEAFNDVYTKVTDNKKLIDDNLKSGKGDTGSTDTDTKPDWSATKESLTANKTTIDNDTAKIGTLVQANNFNIVNKASLKTSNLSEAYWKDYIATKQVTIDDLNEEFKIPYDNSLGLFSDIELFNPLDVLNKNKVTINEYITNLSKNNKEIETKVSDKERKDNEAVKAIYDTCDLNSITMSKDLSEAFKASQETLSAGLKKTKESKSITSSNTVSNLSNLANKLPNTKIGTVENTNIYKFIADPINSINTHDVLGSKSK